MIRVHLFLTADVSGGEEEEEAKQITVKFARQETERVKRAREKSFNYLSKKSAEEPWYHTEFFTADSRLAEVSCNVSCNVNYKL